jgi:hypothetical protein
MLKESPSHQTTDDPFFATGIYRFSGSCGNAITIVRSHAGDPEPRSRLRAWTDRWVRRARKMGLDV